MSIYIPISVSVSFCFYFCLTVYFSIYHSVSLSFFPSLSLSFPPHSLSLFLPSFPTLSLCITLPLSHSFALSLLSSYRSLTLSFLILLSFHSSLLPLYVFILHFLFPHFFTPYQTYCLLSLSFLPSIYMASSLSPSIYFYDFLPFVLSILPFFLPSFSISLLFSLFLISSFILFLILSSLVPCFLLSFMT